MLELLTNPGNMPFSVALGMVLVLAVIQVVGLADLLGADTHADIDVPEAHVDGHVALDAGLLSLIGLGRVPFMMWLMILLSLFGVIGLAGQELLAALSGTPWSAWLAGPAAGVLALPATGAVCRPLGRILPSDETSAVDVASLEPRPRVAFVATRSATVHRARTPAPRAHDPRPSTGRPASSAADDGGSSPSLATTIPDSLSEDSLFTSTSSLLNP